MITVYGTRLCGDCTLARRTLEQELAAYRWVDIDCDPGAAELVLGLNGGYRTVPTIVFPDGRVLVEPTRAQLKAQLSA